MQCNVQICFQVISRINKQTSAFYRLSCGYLFLNNRDAYNVQPTLMDSQFIHLKIAQEFFKICSLSAETFTFVTFNSSFACSVFCSFEFQKSIFQLKKKIIIINLACSQLSLSIYLTTATTSITIVIIIMMMMKKEKIISSLR